MSRCYHPRIEYLYGMAVCIDCLTDVTDELKRLEELGRWADDGGPDTERKEDGLVGQTPTEDEGVGGASSR